MNIGENIKKYRKEKKITQKLLASLINKNIRTVQKYENGEIDPPLEVLIDISEALKVTINELTGEKHLTSSQLFLNDIINEYDETLESLSEKTGVPLNELEALYNNTNGCSVGTYQKFYNYFGLSDKDALLYLTSDVKINSIYNNNGVNEQLNLVRDVLTKKVDLENDLGLKVDYDVDMEEMSTIFMDEFQESKPISENPDNCDTIKNLDIIDSILSSSKLYLHDYKKHLSIYEIEILYKNKILLLNELHEIEIENMKNYIKNIESIKDELNKMLKEKNLIIDKLERIIHNLEENNNSQT